MDMHQLIFLTLLLIVFPGAVWGISALFSRKNVMMTGRGIVRSHRVARSSTWNYLVCFELSDGSTLELHTTKGDYQTLADGQSGQLTWEDDLLCHFDPDTPQ